MEYEVNNYQFNIKDSEDKVHKRVRIFYLRNKLRRIKTMMKIVIKTKRIILDSFMVRIGMNRFWRYL